MYKDKDGFTYTGKCFIPDYYLDIKLSEDEKIEGIFIKADDTKEMIEDKIIKAIERFYNA